MKIDDMALFMKNYHKGMKRNRYKIVQRRFPNKKRTCHNCGSMEHFIAKCPYDKKENKYKRENNEGKHEQKRDTSKWERHTLVMSGTQVRSQAMRM